jgi:hypothetical protein
MRAGDAPLPDAEMQKLLDAAAAWFAAPTPGPHMRQLNFHTARAGDT